MINDQKPLPLTPLPLTIVSGYLGAGKTTLINHLLRHTDGRRLIVLVNDFGELPIDADLIESQDGDTLNLANGCACCSMGGDLFNALVNVLDRTPRPDHLLIEASGVADPVRIANIALAEPDLILDGTLCLVDAENIGEYIKDDQIGETVSHQLASSDLILVNKLDLIDDKRRSELTELLANYAPKAQKIETKYSRIPIDVAIGSHDQEAIIKKEQLLTGDHSEPYIKWSKVSEDRLNRSRFEKALNTLGDRLLRMKGIVYFSDSDKPHIVQYVGARGSITQGKPAMKANHHSSRLVAISIKGRIEQSELDTIFSEF
jgi:G3E family GTPase